MKYFTQADVSKHNNNEDCWIIIDGDVYDITDWADSHPGGAIFTVLAGEDASAMFHSCHLSNVDTLLHKFKIGELSDYQPIFSTYNDEFLITLKQRVKTFFADNNINYRSTPNNKRNIFLTSIILFFCWWCIYFLPPWGFLASIPMGFATCSLIGSFGHELIHGSLFIKSKKKGLLYRLINNTLWGLFIPFMPERYFQYEHIKHHNAPLNPKHDYDVYALQHFVRLSPDVEKKRFHSYQHIYAPFVYGFYIFLQIYYGYFSPFFDDREILKDKGVILNILMMNVISILFYIAIPIYLTNIWWVLLCTGTYFFTWQLAIYLSSGAPHMTDANAYKKQKSWAYHVCLTTKNLKCGHPLFDWLTGGLNHHLAHHLLPSVPKEHLSKVMHIVEDTCKEFNYPFYTYSSFISYWQDHYTFLRDLGNTNKFAVINTEPNK